MRPWVLLPVACVLGLFATSAFAAGKIASVDIQKLLQEAPQIKASEALLEQDYAPREKAIEQERARVKTLRKAYQALGPGSNGLQRAHAMQSLTDAEKKLQKQEQSYAKALTLRRRELRANFKDVVSKDIQTYATEHGFGVVVGDDVIYAGTATDITNAILAILKRDYSKVQTAARKPAAKKRQ